ncbi:MAG: DUF87 domain-containing protein [Chloroflexi bacterium]|nr:DUF87 domain-containing protein [Chloroflexota bacterium]
MIPAPPERLGSFYLGALYDLDKGEYHPPTVNYDARDLTTHAVVVGMTGSGKTGLCIGLLEEAALDQVPAILIDPKGDVTNLLLQFPELRPEDFRPWINPDDARRKGMTPDEYAAYIAKRWREGLAEWGIGPERIRRLQAAADYTIYTPGSHAGIPVNILGSLAAPDLDFEEHTEAIRERITGTVAALLSLMGIKADPTRSREAILLANIFEHYWRQGQDLDLNTLINAIQNPPVRQLGVFDVDTFFPPQDRFELAMALNTLIASPNFRAWLEGDPLDIDALYWTEDGKPRHSIFYIAHLSEHERMFFVTLLLESLVTWVRRQSGTTSLRSLLYFDEVFGYMPPVSEPPSKRPLLTLLKQARAFGLGLVLVTQNPVDIDYKGLTNAGTWFIGKLQAERDKERVLQGLKGAIAAAGGSVEADYDEIITRLRSRVFLMHNVHEPEPIVFHTRWVMSYLRGPLTRPQIEQLMREKKRQRSSTPDAVAPAPGEARVQATQEAPAADVPEGYTPTPPALPPGVPQVFLPIEVDKGTAVRRALEQVGDGEVERVDLVYEPGILGIAMVRFLDRKRRIDKTVRKVLLAPPPSSMGTVNWEEAEQLPLDPDRLRSAPESVPEASAVLFALPPEGANSPREFKRLQKDLADWLYHNSRLTIKVHPVLKLFKAPDERERDFRVRVRQAAREQRDAAIDKVEAKYAKRLDRLQDRLERLERTLEDAEAEYEARKRETLLSVGETVLSFFMGRRRSVTTVASKHRMSSRLKRKIEDTQEEIDEIQQEIEELNEELQAEIDEIKQQWEEVLDDIEEDAIKPRRADIQVEQVALAWRPYWRVVVRTSFGRESVLVPAYNTVMS